MILRKLAILSDGKEAIAANAAAAPSPSAISSPCAKPTMKATIAKMARLIKRMSAKSRGDQ